MTATMHLESMEVAVPAALVAKLDVTTGADPSRISEATEAAVGKVQEFLVRNRLVAAGPPRAIYTSWGPAEVRFTVAVPISEAPTPLIETEGVTVEAIPESTALRFVHHGPYRELRATYARIEAWLRERGGIRTAADWERYSPMWEEYVSDPATTPESELVTRIFLTLR